MWKMKSGETNTATISQMKEQVKEIIESIPVEILQRVIGDSAVAFETVL